MREVHVSEIVPTVKKLLIDANYHIGQDIVDAFDKAIQKDESPVAKGDLKELKENVGISAEGEYPIFQDTGLYVLFVDIDQDVHSVGENIREALNEGDRHDYNDA